LKDNYLYIIKFVFFSMSDDFHKEYEFQTQTCGALLLQFTEPKVYDLAIPHAYHVGDLVVIAGRLMNGEEIKPESIDCMTSTSRYSNSQRLKKEHFSKFSSRVSEGLMKILSDSRDEETFLSFYMRHSTETLAHEWHMGEGDWYRFRDGKREEVEKEVLAYFDELEWADFQRIGNLFQPYIERVGAPHEHKE
jgi:hypothetical protein